MTEPAHPSPLVAVITGATSGIGHAIALALARRGAHLALVGRSPERLQSTTADVAAAGGQAEPFMAHLTDAAETTALGERLRDWAPRLDVLVHSAGIAVGGGHRDMVAEDIDHQWAVNVRAPMLLTAALSPALVGAGGTIIVLNSSAGLKPAPGHSSYASSKAALRSWTDALRDELSGQGVRVCSLYPGRVATPMQSALYDAAGRAAEYQPELLLQADDIAATVEFVLNVPARVEITDLSIRPALRSY
jgi:NADP-dependent 3-hydroxy acid dehydrogenase YdfG